MNPNELRRRLLAAMMGADDDEQNQAARPLPEAMVAELEAIHAAYEKGCPFRPGDLVTPRRGRNIRAEGEPHIVLEVFI